jgi:hypothetical protein
MPQGLVQSPPAQLNKCHSGRLRCMDFLFDTRTKCGPPLQTPREGRMTDKQAVKRDAPRMNQQPRTARDGSSVNRQQMPAPIVER